MINATKKYTSNKVVGKYPVAKNSAHCIKIQFGVAILMKRKKREEK